MTRKSRRQRSGAKTPTNGSSDSDQVETEEAAAENINDAIEEELVAEVTDFDPEQQVDLDAEASEDDGAVRIEGLPPIDENTEFTGMFLKQVREARGVSLKDISDRTKIGVPSLSAIEDERYEDLPNARIYVRGFVRCIAQELGLNEDHVSTTYLPRWAAWHEEQKEKQKHDFR